MDTGGEYPLGMDFAKALELEDYVIDFEITPNRPDCLSMVGMQEKLPPPLTKRCAIQRHSAVMRWKKLPTM